jgi:hypothetical protein
MVGQVRRIVSALALACVFAAPAGAALVSVNGPVSSRGTAASIIPAPADVADSGAFNSGMQGFDEAQRVRLTAALAVDGGVIAAGTWVSSHMIFLNRDRTGGLRHGNRRNPVEWTFDDVILGVMSDRGGTLEAASSALLGNPGTFYPGAFPERGLEVRDGYRILAANVLGVRMRVTEPGDWIRVVTLAEIPLPAAGALFGGALAALALVAVARRRRRS